MKTILTIGHQHFLLASSANVNAIIATLSKAHRCDRTYRTHGYIYHVSEGEPEIEITLVKDSQIIERPKRKQIAEKASPDAHNTFGGPQ